MYTLKEDVAEALVIHCSDPRFQEAFRKFIQEELRITHYVPLIIPGAVAPIGIQDLQPKYFKTLYQQVKLLTDINHVSRVVIINHEECRGYERLKGFFLAKRIHLPEQQEQDLMAAAKMLKNFLPAAHVELFQARLTENKEIYFDKIV